MTKEIDYQDAIQKLTQIADALDKDPKELTEDMAEIVSALTKKHGDVPSDDNWDNVWDMFEDIREHAKNNGRAVIEEDRPIQLRLAWRCTNTNKTWSIRITDFKKSIDDIQKTDASASTNRGDLLRKAIMTQSGKENLTRVLNSKE